jgi:NADP-dependent 3-hydroxy acid dehydrogenase YdfG
MSNSIESLKLSSLFSVEGKIVVVTGGGTGIGRMIATTFAVNGSKVYITGRRSDVLEATARQINAQVKEHGGKGSVVP